MLEGRLRDRKFIMGEEPSDYSIADIAIFPWVRGLSVHYEAQDALKLADFPAVSAWVERCADRPASVKGFTVPAAG